VLQKTNNGSRTALQAELADSTSLSPDLRQRCRHCRSKLPIPVGNPNAAFCTPGCRNAFYRHRCLICEQPLERKTERQLICGRLPCRSALRARQRLDRYLAPSQSLSPPEKPANTGTKSAAASDRASAWHIVAHAPITANQFHCALVGAEAAVAEAERINDAHWQAEAAGKPGYRRRHRSAS
jgi:hypothetical protein